MEMTFSDVLYGFALAKTPLLLFVRTYIHRIKLLSRISKGRLKFTLEFCASMRKLYSL